MMGWAAEDCGPEPTLAMPEARWRLLLLPGELPESQCYRAIAEAAGQDVVGASWQRGDPAAANYRRWADLPAPSHPTFDDNLMALLAREDIATVFCPVEALWHRLEALFARCQTATELVRPSPAERQAAALIDLARRSQAESFLFGGSPRIKLRPKSSQIERMAFLKRVAEVDGDVDEAMAWLLTDVARAAPRGDFVAVGELCGRLAFVLSWLASQYDIGNVLCVDATHTATPANQPGAGAKANAPETDHGLLYFMINLMPSFQGRLNYTRAPAEAALATYAKSRTFESRAFGRTEYRGEISVLTLDTAISPSDLNRILATWGARVVPHGWILFRNYDGCSEDVVHQTVNKFVSQHWESVSLAVTTGRTMFIQLSQPLNRPPQPLSPVPARRAAVSAA